MNRLWAPLLLALLLMVPVFVHAQSNIPLFDPEWQLVPEASELDSDCPVGAPLGFGGVLQLIQNVMNASVSFGVIICVIVIAFAGILWILTPTNPESHSQAKNVLTNAVIGFLIILSAWVIVDFVMKMLYSGTDGQQGVFGPWNEILTGGDICVVATSTKPLFSGNIFSVPGQSTGGTGGGSVGGGTCQVQTTGACAESNLRIFGTAAANASKICTAESHGNASAVSGTDRLGDAARTPYSFGLFQINITAHRINGLDCPSAFSKKSCTLSSCGPGTGVRVTNVALYNRCAAAAKSLQGNIEVAHRIYRDANSSWSPWGTARGCGLADNGAGKTVAFGTIGL